MSAPLHMLLDGQPVTAGWPLDRCFQYGDGLFETMVVHDGRIRFEALHRARLAEGCRRLAITLDAAGLWRDARQVAAQLGQAMLKLQVSRGEAIARGYGVTGTERARAIVLAYPAAPADLPARVRAATLDLRLGENPALAGLKHCNRLEQVLARQELAATGAWEGLVGSSSGLAISGTMSNVFIELEQGWVTPALDRCGIAGVMRAVVLREARRLGAPVREAEVPLAALQRCSGLAFSNVRIGLVPVHELDGRELPGSARLQPLARVVGALEA